MPAKKKVTPREYVSGSSVLIEGSGTIGLTKSEKGGSPKKSMPKHNITGKSKRKITAKKAAVKRRATKKKRSFTGGRFVIDTDSFSKGYTKKENGGNLKKSEIKHNTIGSPKESEIIHNTIGRPKIKITAMKAKATRKTTVKKATGPKKTK